MGKEELKQMIIELRMENVRLRIPGSHCPYACFPSVELPNEIKEDGCNNISCDECKNFFFEKIEEMITEEVSTL